MERPGRRLAAFGAGPRIRAVADGQGGRARKICQLDCSAIHRHQQTAPRFRIRTIQLKRVAVHAMKMLTVEHDKRGIARVILARTARLNAFDEAMIAELTETFRSLSASAKVRCVVLAAEGRCFCAGADIHWMRRQSDNTFERNLADSRAFAEMLRLIAECEKP